MRKQELYDRVISFFLKEMPEVNTELHFATTFQLLCAVVLSAQCTDKRINMVTPALFAAYPDAAAMSAAEEFEVLEYIKSVSYPNAKARHLVGLARQLTERFNGEVPNSLDALTSLPGVGRKTANVVMSVAFGEARMAVDTHVFRVSHRIGLVGKVHNTPLKVEQQLVKHIPEALIPKAHHWLILHGRYVCTAKKPHCQECGLKDICLKKDVS